MNYLLYQIEVAIVLVAFYVIYKIVISGSTNFFLKRIYLLSSLILGFIVPFINLNVNLGGSFNYSYLLREVIVTGETFHQEPSGFEFYFWCLCSVLFFSILILVFHLKQVYKLFVLAKVSTKTLDGKFKIFTIQGNEAFSFFNSIFLGANLTESCRRIILKHEKEHSVRYHSADLLLVNIMMLMQWFNPAFWLFMKAIKENHEYEVDKRLLLEGVSIKNYQELMLNQLFQTRALKFSSFNYNSFIKKRIKMMTKINLPAGKTRFYLATVLLLCVVTLFSFKETNKESLIKVSSINTNLQVEEPLLDPEQRASFNGGDLDVFFSEYVMKAIIYPKEAKKKKQEGKVYVQFIVEKDGKILDTKVLRSSGFELLDDEAVRVIKNSSSWTPAKDKGKSVRQSFTLPVVFKLK